MGNDAYLEIQENLFEYFDNVEDKQFVDFVDAFVYDIPVKLEGSSKLIEKFLEDNDIQKAFLNYQLDLRNKEKIIFFRSTMSQRTIIEQIKQALLSLAYNRFRNLV